MLSEDTKKIIDLYLNLPILGIKNIRCPYYNNAFGKKRAELRALIGKGNPEEIASEALIISKQYSGDILKQENITATQIIDFLVTYNLGIDCSGLVSQILKTAKPDFTKKINFQTKNIWRKMIARLRPIENLSARIYALDRNTKLLTPGDTNYDWTQIQPMDLIIMLEMPRFKNQDHILLITEVAPDHIKYIHSRQWISELAIDSGVTEGIIKITEPGKSLLAQEWVEKNKTGQENETFSFKAKEAKILQVRRLNA